MKERQKRIDGWLKVHTRADWIFSIALVLIMLIGLVAMYWFTRR